MCRHLNLLPDFVRNLVKSRSERNVVERTRSDRRCRAACVRPHPCDIRPASTPVSTPISTPSVRQRHRARREIRSGATPKKCNKASSAARWTQQTCEAFAVRRVHSPAGASAAPILVPFPATRSAPAVTRPRLAPPPGAGSASDSAASFAAASSRRARSRCSATSPLNEALPASLSARTSTGVSPRGGKRTGMRALPCVCHVRRPTRLCAPPASRSAAKPPSSTPHSSAHAVASVDGRPLSDCQTTERRVRLSLGEHGSRHASPASRREPAPGTLQSLLRPRHRRRGKCRTCRRACGAARRARRAGRTARTERAALLQSYPQDTSQVALRLWTLFRRSSTVPQKAVSFCGRRIFLLALPFLVQPARYGGLLEMG